MKTSSSELLIFGALGVLAVGAVIYYKNKTAAAPSLPQPATVQASAAVRAWQATPWGDVNDPNSPAYACSQAAAEKAAGATSGPYWTKCNAWRNQ